MTRYLFGRESQPEEQGSFCDTGSSRHYCNQEREEALNNAAKTEEFGGKSDFRSSEGTPIDPKDVSQSSRVNTTLLEVDTQGYEFPTRYDPGR